ncbi:putative nucleoside-diphosphate-sugar epimerase [Phaeomoniella chlamydospora]|uniref:Putative nucleoside-diphosphate-sugar epimerase n=1 Tax=Phaeomoniella chlamydospora TaxID=158046 RepID=A0A0G2GGX8_PHACM|nr:putative nucleoside-diphosphate-sugar epimerase [Phaeomoniella chlamydospora]
MHILITGASGFIGQLVARELLKDSSHTLVLTDIVAPTVPTKSKYPQNAKCLQADLCKDAAKIVEAEPFDAAYVFHGIMSSGSEANFDLGMTVNVDATRALLETFRTLRQGVRIIYASSQAVYGRPFPEVVDETVRPYPESSYGAEKLICETLINDYTRRGFIDGFCLRFPTITVRPGRPTQAASSFLSGMIREPLNGQPCVIPIEDRSFVSWICSPKTLAENLIYALTVESSKLPLHIREVNMPGIGATVQDMLDALKEVGGSEALDLITEKADPAQEAILRSWATKFDNTLAYSVGFKPDSSFKQAVIDYKASLTE